MPKQYSNEWYYNEIVKDAKDNPDKRTFTISHVPKEQKAAVIKLLKDNWGGNKTDKKLGEFAQKTAFTIPAAAGTMTILPQTLATLYKFIGNPTLWKGVVLPTLGGEVSNKVVRQASNGKYTGFGDWAYNSSGANIVNDTVLEEPIKLLFESANPGLYMSSVGKLVGTGVKKAVNAAEPAVQKVVDSNTELRKIRYKINDYLDGVDDLVNHVKNPQKAGSKYFDEWKKGAEKTVNGNTTTYTKGNYVMTESPGKMVFTDADNTFRIGNFTDNSYYVTVTPAEGAKTAPISTVKTVYNVVDRGNPGTYFVADPTSIPKGLLWKDMYDNKNYSELVKSMLGLDDTFKLSLSGYSTDAHKYINLFRKSPSVATRYNPVPMTTFNTLGQDATNKQLLTWMTVADIAKNKHSKQVMLDKINQQLSTINADPAYLQNGLIQIPQPSLMVKYPVKTTTTPMELLASNTI